MQDPASAAKPNEDLPISCVAQCMLNFRLCAFFTFRFDFKTKPNTNPHLDLISKPNKTKPH